MALMGYITPRNLTPGYNSGGGYSGFGKKVPGYEGGFGGFSGYGPSSVPVSYKTYGTATADTGGAPNMGQLYGDVMKQLRGFGNAQQAGLRQEYLNAMGRGQQSLASSGLAGTTIAPSMRMGYMQAYGNSLNNLNQQLTAQRIGAQSQLGTAANQQALQYAGLNQAGEQGAQRLGLGYASLNQQAVAQQEANRMRGQAGGGGVDVSGFMSTQNPYFRRFYAS
jgi:hypothetical protein